MQKVITSDISNQVTLTFDLLEGTLKMRDRKMWDWKMRHQTARMENAGLENRGNDIVWNTVYY